MTMHDEPMETYDIGELAALTEVTRRTVRYYVAEGLLPSPGGGGQQRTYTREHLLRLRAIKRLKDAYLPLDEIRRRLDGLDARALDEILVAEPEPLPESASDYIAALLGAGAPDVARRAAPEDVLAPPTAASPVARSSPAPETPSMAPPAARSSFTHGAAPPLAAPTPSGSPGSSGSPGVILPAISSFIKERRAAREKGSRGEGQGDAAAPASSMVRPAPAMAATTWQRVALGPGVELHYQETSDERRDAVLGRIIRLAQDLLSHLT